MNFVPKNRAEERERERKICSNATDNYYNRLHHTHTKWITFNQANMRVLIVLITSAQNTYQISGFHLHSSIKSLCTISVTFANFHLLEAHNARFTSATQYGTSTHTQSMSEGGALFLSIIVVLQSHKIDLWWDVFRRKHAQQHCCVRKNETISATMPVKMLPKYTLS